MDPKLNLNYRRTQAHSAELHRRAEDHRLAAAARKSERVARPTTPSGLSLGSLADTARAAFARVSIAARHTSPLGSKTERS